MELERVMHELALFAGAGGGILASELLGHQVRCAVELELGAACCLVQRQNDGCIDPFPIWDDIRTFSGFPWDGHIDIVSGGFPCTDISCAGKRAGIEGEHFGLWKHMARIIGEAKPAFAFIENSPHLRTKGLQTVLQDLAALGFDAEWDCISAGSLGAWHRRDRMWILAAHRDRSAVWFESRRRERENREAETFFEKQSVYIDRTRKQQPERLAEKKWRRFADRIGKNAYTESDRRNTGREVGKQQPRRSESWWFAEPGMVRMVYGLPHRVDRIRALGNAQVPIVAAVAWVRLMERFLNE
jgi:DNA (cytosine-5)-methyltransferase 1